MNTEFYTCPMHPEIIEYEAGSCPKCGMALEQRAKSPPPTPTRPSQDQDEEQEPYRRH